MRTGQASSPDNVADAVRLHVFSQAAETGRVPQAQAIAEALNYSTEEIRAALRQLAASKVLILAPNDGDIWAANPFCAVPSGIRVSADGKQYWGICIWDALGVVAAIGASEATITAPCGDCGESMELRIERGSVTSGEGVIHFAVPAKEWWSNIGFA
jgi:hypothetical protein